jgi:hypothetical protein
MFTRLALILVLIMPQLSLAAIVTRRMPAECRATSCCEVVETTTCCGKRTVEVRCGMSGGDCRCDQQPDRSDDPVPALPATDSTGLVFSLLPQNATVAFGRPERSRVNRAGATGPFVQPHNTRQAFFGLWRT